MTHNKNHLQTKHFRGAICFVFSLSATVGIKNCFLPFIVLPSLVDCFILCVVLFLQVSFAHFFLPFTFSTFFLFLLFTKDFFLLSLFYFWQFHLFLIITNLAEYGTREKKLYILKMACLENRHSESKLFI